MTRTLEDLFIELVQIDSPSGDESTVADFILSYLKNLGLKPTKDRFGMVYCRIGEAENPTLFCNHMDTVEPGRGIVAEISNGYISSKSDTILGADNKAALAAVLYNIEEKLRSNQQLNLELLFSIEEETYSGIKNFNYKVLESKKALVIDGGSDLNRIVVNSSSIGQFEIELIGTASHTSTPDLGNNVLEAFLSLSDKLKFGMIDKATTLNIGLLKTGSAANTIPGSLSFEGDLRSANQQIFNSQKQKLISDFKSLETSHSIEVKVEWYDYTDAYSINQSSNNLEKLKQIYASNGLSANLSTATGGSDAGFLNKVGIESFCLGDGVENPHTTRERISINNLETLSKIVSSLIDKF